MEKMNIYKFPENFKWGSATSSHQIEGGNNNDWSEWERSPARIEELKKQGKNPIDFISGRSCDSYNRYREDFDIAKQLDHSIHRLSIEWSRIEPEEGRFDEKAMQHYVDVVKALRDRGIEPMITLWHFTNPIWFANKGGFLNKKSPEYFTRYAKHVVDNLKEKVGLWITFNEATTVYSGHSYIKGLWPPGHRSLLEGMRVNRNIVKSHIAAYKAIKNLYGHSPVDLNNKSAQNIVQDTRQTPQAHTSHNVEVGLVENGSYVAYGTNLFWKIAGKIYNYYRNLYVWKNAFPYYDFMGLNYYHIDRYVPGSYRVVPRQDWHMEDMGWEVYPKGIYYVLRGLQKFKRPIYITENGTADKTDKIREKFIKEHLRWVWQAINDGVDVRGYLYWSLLDNFEWAYGFIPRFGLVEIDYKTLERHIRPSALEYGKICRENTLSI